MLGLALGAALVAPLQVEAQAQQAARVGRLSPLSAEADAAILAAFRSRMRELGWLEGRNFTLVARFADGRAARLPELADELVRQGVDVILAGSSPGSSPPSRPRARFRSSWLLPEIRSPTAS